MTDTEIVDRITMGEKALYEIIVRRFNPYLYKIGRSYNFNHADTQDLMQETFLDAYKHLVQFAGRSGLKTWLIRIMMNNCYRKSVKLSFKNEKMYDIDDHAKPMFSNSGEDTEKRLQKREFAHILEEALSKIPLPYRIAFSLREINGLDVSETAELLKLSEANVKVRLHRAKAMLRREIEKKYTASELFEFNLVFCDRIVEQVMNKINLSSSTQ